MDMFPIEFLKISGSFFKYLFFVIGSAVFAINYFQAREAKNIEQKLKVNLPGSVHAVLSFQLILSLIFVFAMLIILLFP